jgi:hypothetical protein
MDCYSHKTLSTAILKLPAGKAKGWLVFKRIADSTLLYEVCYEWGDMGNSEAANARVTNLAPKAPALIWRDDGSGAELRMDLWLRVETEGREARLYFGFPKLYRLYNLPMVEGLDKCGWQVAAEG